MQKFKSSLKYITAKDGLLTFKCLECNKTYKKKFNEDLSKRFGSTYQFYDGDNHKICLVLQRGVYPFECVDGWE